MKPYDRLAWFYDDLLKDDVAMHAWVSFVKRHFQGKTLLEAACGSGEITIALAKEGYQVIAGDISRQMLEQANRKDSADQISWKLFDMRDLSMFQEFECICCFCDSLNYLIEEKDVLAFLKQAYFHLDTNGVLLFDMHSLDRLIEFEEEYCEAGTLQGVPYEWTISKEDDRIYQTFAFYDSETLPSIEQHVQRVYDPHWMNQRLMEIGFEVEVFTDFDLDGIQAGEKYFYVCRKG